MRFFTGNFAFWNVHFVNICVKNQQNNQLFIQFISYVCYPVYETPEHRHTQSYGRSARTFPLLARDSSLSPRNKIMLYRLLIRPILTYAAAPVWSNTSNTNYRHLQTLQSKCLRVTGNYSRRTPISLLHFALKIEPLYELIYRLSDKIFHQCSIHQNPLVRQIGDYTIVNLQHRYKKYIHKRTKLLLL
jgi:hypothetical protein